MRTPRLTTLVLSLCLPAILTAQELPSGPAVGLGLTSGDILSGTFTPGLKPLFWWDISGTGLSLGLDDGLITFRRSETGFLAPRVEFSLSLGDSPWSVVFGNQNDLVFGPETLVSGFAFPALRFAPDDIDAANLELHVRYLTDNSWGFGLGGLLGLGWTFDLAAAGELQLWADINFDLYRTAGLGDIEATISWTKSFGPVFVGLEIAPTWTPSPSAVSVEPTAFVGMTF